MDAKEMQAESVRLIEARLPIDRAWGSTVGIVVAVNGNLHQHGTGTLFRIADESLLMTASHVLEQAFQAGKGLGITGPSGHFIPLRGESKYTSHPGGDPFDVGFVQLTIETVHALEGATFLTLADVCFDNDLTDGVFCLFAYPSVFCQEQSDTFLMQRWQYTTGFYLGDASVLADFQDQYHIALRSKLSATTDFDGNQISFTRFDGNTASFPGDLGGISGCSVWKIGKRADILRGLIGEKPRIVGIETSVYPRAECIRATRWKAAAELIRQAIPSLERPLSLYRF